MMRMSRRRLLLFAAVSGSATIGPGHVTGGVLVWRGFAMGADAEIRMAGLDASAASRIVRLARSEIDRLERAFSLHDPQSELSCLNRERRLDGASHDFRHLLAYSLSMHARTGGAFNPAIQPVWQYLAGHFARSAGEPDRQTLRQRLALADPAGIDIHGAKIRLRRNMALTFNGIAQGYITDRVAELLRAEGLTDILIDLGEFRALPGRSWQIGELSLSDRALAISTGRGTPLSADGRWHHLIDPHTGTSPAGNRDVVVTTSTATEADALSTAFSVAHPETRLDIVERFPGAAFSLRL